MEGYVFALMANSGTDPELEAEDELEEIRNKELELRYLVKLDENGQAPERSKSAEKLMSKVDERLMSESRVVDHYSPCWPPGEKSPTPPHFSPKWPEASSQHPSPNSVTRAVAERLWEELEEDQDTAKLVEVPEEAPCYLIKLDIKAPSARSCWPQRTQLDRRIRPSRFQPGIAASNYRPLPPLKLALPSFRRCPIPLKPQRKDNRTGYSKARTREKHTIHQACSKPPEDPVKGLVYQSCEVLKRHYNSLTGVCFLKLRATEQ